MQISEQWLREWVNPSIDSVQLVETLTMLGLEVDSMQPAATDFSSVVVGEVLSAEQHPNADRLRVCQVNLGKTEPVQVVCGGVNVRAGLKIAFVQVGGVLPGGFQIKKAKLRGVESSGMICSSKELQLGEDEAGFIVELPLDAPVGQDLRQYLQLEDKIFDIALTPNRGDCASIQGLARELSAKFSLPMHKPKHPTIAVVHENKQPVTLSAEQACPRYVGRIIKNINSQATTPLWMQERLRRAGLRGLHPVVDISNYVMLELGQPLHAFDLDQLTGKITVRYAKPGEKIILLDNAEVELTEAVVVIADEKGPQAIAGIKGGKNSAVCANTTTIFLESAYFDPTCMFKSAHQLNLSTDSSYRFERGVDFNLQELAAERFTQLVVEICGGEPGPLVMTQNQAHLPAVKTIHLRHAQIKRILGVEYQAQTVEKILTSLGLTLQAQGEGWQVTVPSYRFDLTAEIDLIEELIRLAGYEQLPAATMELALKAPEQAANAMPYLRPQQLLMDLGYSEAITYSFIDTSLAQLISPQEEFLQLINPLSREMSIMRTSLWPGLIQCLQYNLNRQVEHLRIFETGLCFTQKAGEILQEPKIAGLIAGYAEPWQWGITSRKVDFFDLKGDVERLFALIAQAPEFHWQPSSNPVLHPGKSADVYLRGMFVGSLGALHPQLVATLGLSAAPYVFEFDYSIFKSIDHVSYTAVSKYPAVRRDLAIVIDGKITAATILDSVLAFAGPLLREVKIFDIYQGERIEAGKKSVAMGLIFQDTARTLVEQEVNDAVSRVVCGLEDQLKATLRA